MSKTKVKIIEDSISPCGVRITTMQATYPRLIHSELLTHRVLSRNTPSSSRAIPIRKNIAAVFRSPATPFEWGANQAGMQAGQPLSGIRLWIAKRSWMLARYPAVAFAYFMSKAGVHKQVANRILEPSPNYRACRRGRCPSRLLAWPNCATYCRRQTS